jgi:hypothetical protein
VVTGNGTTGTGSEEARAREPALPLTHTCGRTLCHQQVCFYAVRPGGANIKKMIICFGLLQYVRLEIFSFCFQLAELIYFLGELLYILYTSRLLAVRFPANRMRVIFMFILYVVTYTEYVYTKNSFKQDIKLFLVLI